MPSLEHDWYDAPLPDGVELGERSWLYSSYAFLHCKSEVRPRVRLAPDSGVYDGSMFELGPRGSVSIGRFSSVVAAIIRSNGAVMIEDYALVSWNVYICTTADEIATPPVDGRLDEPDPPLVIGEGAWVGAGAILLRGASVGRNAIVGAGAVVRQPVPPGVVVAGNPARIVSSR